MSDILDTMKSLTDDPDTKVRLVRLADIYEVIAEIERLRSDNARMREALWDALAELSPLMGAYRPEHADEVCGKVRAALEPEGR